MMFNFRIQFIVYTFAFLISLPLLTFANHLTPAENQFISTLAPAIHRANQHIWHDRERLMGLYQSFQKQHQIKHRDQQWLLAIAKQYEVKPEFKQDQTWQSLLSRVDSVPSSLVLAQAINESAWGRSRFAKEGNNYFGQWCYTKGCGIIPAKRPPGKTYEVKRFSSVDSSITHYLHNLNTNPSYKKLRQLRAELRKENKPLNSIELSQGLVHYSSRGAAYVKSLQAIIHDFHLEQYDLTQSK